MQTRMSGGPPGDWKMEEKPVGWLGADGWGCVGGGGRVGVLVLLLAGWVDVDVGVDVDDMAGGGAEGRAGGVRWRLWVLGLCWVLGIQVAWGR